MWYRDIVEEPRYSEDLDHLRSLYSELDDVQEIISWTLSRDARIGQPLPYAPDFRVITTSPIGSTPSFWVLYTFDTNHVYLHSLAIATE